MKCPKCGNSAHAGKGKTIPGRSIRKRYCLNDQCKHRFYTELIAGVEREIDPPADKPKGGDTRDHTMIGRSVQKRVTMGWEEAAAQINVALFGQSKFHPWRRA